MTLDAAEALANAIVGLLVSMALVHLAWPIFGWPVTTPQSAAVSLIFFIASALRSFALRRIFRAAEG